MAPRWLVLIYTVPSEPSRKRAFIWRELKKAGAVYLRDGVCALPERPETLAALSAIAARVEELGGQATLVHLGPDGVHQAHDLQRAGVRHQRAFQQPGPETALHLGGLVLVAGARERQMEGWSNARGVANVVNEQAQAEGC